MAATDFTTSFTVNQSPEEVFKAILNVRGWWSGIYGEEIEGITDQLNETFIYKAGEGQHYSAQKLVELDPYTKIVWLVTDSKLTFLEDTNEWAGTKLSFDISTEGDTTKVIFTHQGLVPGVECYDTCSSVWPQYIHQGLMSLINTGKGLVNGAAISHSMYQLVTRFMELAKQEKWFEIQDELFSDDVKSIDPENSPYFGYAEGKAAVRKKGEDWVSKIEAVHMRHTTEPLIAGNHFAVGRNVDITVQGHGRVQFYEIMLYEVKDGKIISEQFFY